MAEEDLLRAVRLIGASELARRMDIPSTTVSFWVKRGRVPKRRTERLRQAARGYVEELAQVLGARLVYGTE